MMETLISIIIVTIQFCTAFILILLTVSIILAIITLLLVIKKRKSINNCINNN